MNRFSVVAGAYVGILISGLARVACAQELGQSQTSITVIPLKYKYAAPAAKKVASMFANDGSVVILADERSNTVFIRANAEQTRQVKEHFLRLDVETCTSVFSLNQGNAIWVASALSLATHWYDDDIHVIADLRNHCILVSANQKRIEQISSLLERLGVKELEQPAGPGTTTWRLIRPATIQ